MLKYQILYWRDIPVQVRLKVGRERRSFPLTARFQEAIFRAAYRGKAIHGEAYLEEWVPTAWRQAAGDPTAVGNHLCSLIEAAYPDARLNELALHKGVESAGRERPAITLPPAGAM